MVPLMLNGTYNPGQLEIVREILDSAGPDFDTAVFSGIRANYTITVERQRVTVRSELDDDVVTVTDNVGTDGTDRLTNIERLQFADQSVVRRRPEQRSDRQPRDCRCADQCSCGNPHGRSTASRHPG